VAGMLRRHPGRGGRKRSDMHGMAGGEGVPGFA
jgi:hypothetical protein